MSRLGPVAVALLIAVALSGCTSKDMAEVREALAGAKRGQIVIGVAWPFASNDGGLSAGIELALEEVNLGGGVNGQPIRILRSDDEGTATRGMAVAQAFAAKPEVVAVIGHRNSYVTLPASSIYERAGLVMLTPGSTAPEITAQGFRYIFRSIPSDALIARELAEFAARRGHKRLAVYYADDSYGRGLANAFEDSAAAAGMTVVDRISSYADMAELRELIRRWKAYDYDGLFVAQTANPAAQFIAAVRSLGVDVPIYGGNAMDSPLLHQIAGVAAEGVVLGTVFDPDDLRPEVQRFVAAFKDRYGYLPSQWAAQGYDALHLLATAMQKAGSTRPTDIAAALRALTDWHGASGLYTFDEAGDQQGSMVVKRVVRDGRLQTLRSVPM
jgi:branched-chain amino acid transport system substrate-binding protein